MTTTMHKTSSTDTPSPDRTLDIVMADDDRNDHLLLLMAAEEAGVVADFTFLDDGSTLMFHLADISDTADLPNLIILDLRMPGLDGHRTLDELQAHPVLWQIPVVVFTSSTRWSDEVRSFDRGARWVETKPSEFEDLLTFVRSLPARAWLVGYEAADEQIEPAGYLKLLSADITADIEDDLMRSFPAGE